MIRHCIRRITTFNTPKPIALGNKQEQREFEDLCKKADLKLTQDFDKRMEKQEEEQVVITTGEIGGPKGLEPTRYGDWERKGRVYDF